MDLFDVDDLIAQHDEREHSYAEFFRGSQLSLGLAIWPAGQPDLQKPHAEDEVYYIVSGQARIRVGDEDRPVRAGSIVFVASGIEHHFHDIEETLRVVVFWAPPHHTRDAAES
jgi:mannose-6-phosphate isomerase-like protein (cupin superfamily)